MANPCAGRTWQARTLRARLAWADANQPCALCGNPINYHLRWPHRLSLTVDHITPLWAGGKALDPTNWQPAHQTCNSSRGAREGNRLRTTGTSTRW